MTLEVATTVTRRRRLPEVAFAPRSGPGSGRGAYDPAEGPNSSVTVGDTGQVTSRQPGESPQGTPLRPPRWQRDAIDAVAGLIAVGLLVVVFGQWLGPVRLLLSVGFTFFVPGRAIVTNWPRMARWSEFAIPIVFSLAILTLLAMITLWANSWHPVGLFEIEAWLSLAGLGVGIARRCWFRRSAVGVRAEPSPREQETRTW